MALVAFYRREWPRLVGAVHLYCGDLEVAEEAAQEALVRACRDWPKVSRMRSPSAWTYRVAVNLANAHYRRRRSADRARTRLEPLDAAEDAGQADRLAVRAALLKLSHRQRAAVVLRFYLGYSLAEVAAGVGVPVGTAKSLIHRALKALRADLSLDLHDSLEESTHA